MIKMASLDPGLQRDLTEAKADLARHGIVILRAVEKELVPAIISRVKASMASSPKSMAKIDEDQLDEYLEKLRRTSEKSTQQLRDLYVRLLAKLGGEQLGELVKELDGIEQLIKWERIAKTVEPVNERLAEKGFGPIYLAGPYDVSESLAIELDQKWPSSFDRFKALIRGAASQSTKSEEQGEGSAKAPRTKMTPRKG